MFFEGVLDLTQKQAEAKKLQVGSRLRELRKQLHLSMEQLAKNIDSTSATISNIENGFSMPSGEILLRLQERLHVSTNWLLCGRQPIFIKTPDLVQEADSQLIFFNQKWHFFCQMNTAYLSTEEHQRLEIIRQLLQTTDRCSVDDLRFVLEMVKKL